MEDWQKVIGVNLLGVAYGVQAFVPRMLAQGRPGTVINTASEAGLVPMAKMAPYCASKFGVVGMSESLNAELSARGIHVVAVCPGVIDAPIVRSGIVRGELADPAPQGGRVLRAARRLTGHRRAGGARRGRAAAADRHRREIARPRSVPPAPALAAADPAAGPEFHPADEGASAELGESDVSAPCRPGERCESQRDEQLGDAFGDGVAELLLGGSDPDLDRVLVNAAAFGGAARARALVDELPLNMGFFKALEGTRPALPRPRPRPGGCPSRARSPPRGSRGMCAPIARRKAARAPRRSTAQATRHAARAASAPPRRRACTADQAHRASAPTRGRSHAANRRARRPGRDPSAGMPQVLSPVRGQIRGFVACNIIAEDGPPVINSQ